jgi:hypothetical protein
MYQDRLAILWGFFSSQSVSSTIVNSFLDAFARLQHVTIFHCLLYSDTTSSFWQLIQGHVLGSNHVCTLCQCFRVVLQPGVEAVVRGVAPVCPWRSASSVACGSAPDQLG